MEVADLLQVINLEILELLVPDGYFEEDFIKNNLPFLSFGKIRASYGTTGNDQLTDYQYLSAYTPGKCQYVSGACGPFSDLLPNNYFSWEVVKKLEGGLELGS